MRSLEELPAERRGCTHNCLLLHRPKGGRPASASSARRANTRRSPLRLRSPLFLAVAFGVVGFLAGGFGGIFGSVWVASGHPPRPEVGVLGEYATPYGLVGGLLGLAAGVWAGLRMSRS